MSRFGRLLNTLRPPANWLTAVNIVMAVIVGLSLYLAYVAKAGSYLSDDPKTCVNCHVMAPEYATWANSSHKNVTNCNKNMLQKTNTKNQTNYRVNFVVKIIKIECLCGGIKKNVQKLKMRKKVQKIFTSKKLRH